MTFWWEFLFGNIVGAALWDIAAHLVKRRKTKDDFTVMVTDPEKVQAIRDLLKDTIDGR